MPKSEEENTPNNFYTKGVAVAEPVMMTMDLDLDGSWTFDQIFSSDPSPSSFILSATEQSFSPLWAFSDDVNTNINNNDNDVLNDGDDKHVGNLTLTSSGGGQRFVSDTDNPETRKPSNNDVKRRLPMPILEVYPSEYQDTGCIIKERMTMALRYFIELGEKHVLAQIWAPVKNKGRNVLTTSGQPFVLDPNCTGLHQYRMASLMYVFSLDGETDGVLGLPGRVFRHKLPEWTPNVQYYSDKEYQRLNHALSYNVRGTLALPVFEPSGQSCVGVLELILTSQKINYAPEVDKVCKALEAVNLKCSNILDSPNTQICNASRQQALAEILEVLAVVCETHNFPLAQTWVPCRHRSVLAYGGGFKKSCSSFDGSCMGQVCMSTTDVAFYVVDAHMWGFREACAEHHLQKGQGVAGRAFATRSSCFCENITHFGKTEYPLVHYARLFGLVGSFAICLRSSHTGDDDYILEFFLPPNMVDCNDQQAMLGSLLTSMKQHFRTLKVASGEEIGEDGRFVEIIKPSVNGDVIDSGIQSIRLSDSVISNGGPLVKEPNALNGHRGKSENVTTIKKSERKRGKAEKSISLEVLQQHFAGSLKDAAKNLGVCPTTMKRICRQHGISRWPSRKINKVNRSLTKLKRVIESVQGGEGTFTIPSLATTQLPLGVDSPSWPTAPNGSPTNQQGSPGSIPYDPPYPKNDQGPTNQTSGSREASAGSPNSQRSSQESQPSEGKTRNVAAELSISDALLAPQTEEPLRGMLIEDAGSSHDLTNLCPVTEPLDRVQQLSPKVQPFIPRTDMKTITIKASYREDIIRFRVAANSGIVNLKEEVAKRLKLDVGTFDIKYLDDDHEWVLIVCDADLQECVELSISSGCNIIRLLVHDLSTILINYCRVRTYCKNVKYAADVDTRMISDKIKHAFSMAMYRGLHCTFQFWAPVTTISGSRRLLSTDGQPFAVDYPSNMLSKYRLRCLKYQYNIIHHHNHNDDVNNNNKQRPDINDQDGQDFNPFIITSDHAPTATAFLNRLPQLVSFINLKGVSPTPLVDSALECHLKTCFMLPVCCPSQSTSCCIGVVELSTCSIRKDDIIAMIRALEEVGLGVFQLQERIPSQILSGLKPAKAEIEDVLKIVCKSNHIALAQVWVPFEDDNHVSFSSYLEGTPKKQMLSLKLMGYLDDTVFRHSCDEYYGLYETFPLEMGEDFVDKTLEDYKPRFCYDVSKLSGDTLVKKLFGVGFSRLAICLNSIHTGDFCYAFEFIWKDWEDNRDSDVEFVEELLLKLKELLPSFKLASGAELGDELDCINVGDSTATETKFLKIFQGERLSPIPEVLEEGTRIPAPMVVDYIAPLEAKYKTTPIPLSREEIEKQFGNTETEAAENLKEPGDELDVSDVENSTSEKILQENIRLPVPEALERGKKPMVENYIAPLARKYKTAPVLLSQEAIEHQYGNTMKEAAKTLNVSISTLKRKCKDFGISEWQGPNLVKRKVHDSSNPSFTNEEYDGAVQDPSAINKNENTLTIKAEYADDMIKFHLGISEATFITVEEKIGKKFKLTHGTYKLKYLDEDKDWILLASDQDMSDCMKSSRNLGRIVVRLRVLPSTQPISGRKFSYDPLYI